MMYPPMCYNCKRQFASDRLKCAAFPKGIPKEIFSSEFDHRERFAGDKGLLYDPIDSEFEITIGGPPPEGVFV